jgi:hypothetical protein
MDYRRRLLFHGMALFLIGLLTGLAEQHFTKHTDGAGRPSRRRNERNFPARRRRDLERGKAVVPGKRPSLLGATRRHIWQLGCNDIRRYARNCCAFTDDCSGIWCCTVARSFRYRRICPDRSCDHFSIDIAFVGAAKQGDARCPMKYENGMSSQGQRQVCLALAAMAASGWRTFLRHQATEGARWR